MSIRDGGRESGLPRRAASTGTYLLAHSLSSYSPVELQRDARGGARLRHAAVLGIPQLGGDKQLTPAPE